MKRFVSLVFVATLACVSEAGAGGAEDGSSNVATLHAQVITPASNTLFQAESTPPATANEWQKIAARATDLAKAAKRLESDELASGRAAWREFAQALEVAAEEARRAAQTQNQDALVTANGNIVSVCEDCHAQYRDAGRSMKD
jgi:hypothetical protein